jgi:hypothetical protein
METSLAHTLLWIKIWVMIEAVKDHAEITKHQVTASSRYLPFGQFLQK